MKLVIQIVAAFASCLLLVSPPAAAQTAHPLVGKIFDTRTGSVTDLADPVLIPKLFPCGAITVLGEVHDNADHHQMRGKLVEAAVQQSSCTPSAFVFEQINADQQVALNKFNDLKRSDQSVTAASLFELIEWDKSGWPSSTLYAPLFIEVIRSKGAILAGDPGRAQSRRVAKEGIGAIGPDQALRLGLDTPLAPAANDALLTELEASHCGLMPKSAFGNMATAQRFRDAYMADVALKAGEASGNVVIFAGSGHVQTDRGIPYYLKQRTPERKVVAVTFVETESGKTDPSDYAPRDPVGLPAADYVAFAAAAKRDDPCEEMRAQFKVKPKQP